MAFISQPLSSQQAAMLDSELRVVFKRLADEVLGSGTGIPTAFRNGFPSLSSIPAGCSHWIRCPA
jgi:hypothetical protein